MIRLTRTGFVFSCVCLLLYVASWTSQSSLLFVPIGILIGCFLLNFFMGHRTVKNIEVRTPSSVQVPEGKRISQPWKLINRSKSTGGFILLSNRTGTLARLATLAGKAALSIVPDLVFTKRGVYPYAEVTLSSLYPFGLIKISRRLNLPGEVVVYPAIYPAPKPQAAGYDAIVGGKFKGKRRAITGSHFVGVRPFQSGDTLKQIHWKSSAKGMGLMAKTFEEELSGRVSFIMDAGHTGDANIFDDCVRAVGSLIFSALDAGDHVEWIDLNDRQLLLIPPFADGHEILDRLARIQTHPGCLNAEHLQKSLTRISTKSAVILVLTDVNQAVLDIISELQTRRRVVSVYLPENSKADLPGVPIFHYASQSILQT